MVLLFAITLVPLVSLLWLGGYLLEEDRLETQRRAEQSLSRAADAVGSALERAIAADEQRAAGGAKEWPEGAVVVTFDQATVEAVPQRLAYYPVASPLPEADSASFDEVDRAESQLKDAGRQIELLERLAVSSDRAVSATARIRLSSVLESAGQHARAIDVLTPALGNDHTGVGGVPVALAARYRRCQILERQHRPTELRTEARTLRLDLSTGRWILNAPAYLIYVNDADRWLRPDATPRTTSERLADAVAALWPDRQRPVATAGLMPPRHTLTVGRDVFTVLWQPRATGTRALVVTQQFVREQWMSKAQDVARVERVALSLAGIGGDSQASSAASVHREARDTGFPWDFRIDRVAAGASEPMSSRRSLLILGLVILMTMAVASSALIARAVHREIAVARMQSDFVNAVSHEFRTPLTTLRQFTEMLREGHVADEERRQLCYDAQSRATSRLTNLVESVLDFGRMEAGKQPYRFETVSCSDVVRPVVDDFQREIEASGYRIRFQADESIEVDADAEALGRALRNLLENAVKYSPNERTVEVDVSRLADTVAIAVRDRGIGVAPDERRAIFNQFHRGAEARTRGIAGTGIGLAMVEHIVRAHKGHVSVDSEQGKGSTFTIVLPVRA